MRRPPVSGVHALAEAVYSHTHTGLRNLERVTAYFFPSNITSFNEERYDDI